MSDSRSLSYVYDSGADVLYLHSRQSVAVRGVEDSAGLVWRYGHDGTVIGMTAVDFRDGWLDKKAQLVDEISSHFSVSIEQATDAVDRAASDATGEPIGERN